MENKFSNIIKNIHFNSDGLTPVIVQDSESHQVLMLAWMNEEALSNTLSSHQMFYYSRSRKKLWHKGETSGQTQELVELKIDCDGDTLLATVKQLGVACHTGRKSCFFKTVKDDKLITNQEVITSPSELYGHEPKP